MIDWQYFRNTYLQMPWLFSLVMNDRKFDAILYSKSRNLEDIIQRLLEKLFWFWPRIIDAKSWAEGAPNTNRTPYNYVNMDSDALLLIDWVQRICPDQSARILDIGCNSGRHLIELWRRGYRNMAGVDAMEAALHLFSERAPEVYSGSKIYHDLFQRFMMKQSDNSFDVIYSHGATIELVHPSFDIVAHLTRVAKTNICLLLNPYNGFRRDWLRQFRSHGFELIYSMEPITAGDQLSLIILRRSSSI